MKKPKYVEINLKLKINYTQHLNEKELKSELNSKEIEQYFISKLQDAFDESWYYSLEFELLKPKLLLK